MAYGYVVEPSAQGSGTLGINFRWAEPAAALRRSIQQALKDLGRYSGPVDGAWGPNTIKGIQKSIARGNYYSGPIDGAVGKNTVIGVIKYAQDGAYDVGAYDDYQRILAHSAPNYSALSTGTPAWQQFRNRLQRAIS